MSEGLIQLPDGNWVRVEHITDIGIETNLVEGGPTYQILVQRTQRPDWESSVFVNWEAAAKVRDELATRANGPPSERADPKFRVAPPAKPRSHPWDATVHLDQVLEAKKEEKP